MPFELQQGEVVIFPAPFVANEPQQLVISTKRVVQYAPEGMYPLAEFPVDKIDHVGRMSERPTMVPGILAAILGVVFLIGSVVKVLPQVMYAGAPAKTEKAEGSGEGDTPEDGIEGRDSQDDDPFDEGKETKENVSAKAKKNLKRVKEVHFGWPGLTEDIVFGFFLALGGGIALLIGRSLYRKEKHMVFCRVGQQVYPIEVKDGIQQNAVVAMIQAAQQAQPKK